MLCVVIIYMCVEYLSYVGPMGQEKKVDYEGGVPVKIGLCKRTSRWAGMLGRVLLSLTLSEAPTFGGAVEVVPQTRFFYGFGENSVSGGESQQRHNINSSIVNMYSRINPSIEILELILLERVSSYADHKVQSLERPQPSDHLHPTHDWHLVV